MKLLKTLPASLLSFCLLLICNPSNAIVGGEYVTIKNPISRSTVSLNIRGRSFCTGTLITRKHILTAAHCISPDRSFTIGFGLSTTNFIKSEVSSVTVHPNYTGLINQNNQPIHDIAIVELKNDSPNGFMPVNITDRFVIENEPLILAGFGATDFFNGRSGQLKFVVTQVQVLLPTTSEFMFGPTPGKSACRGDSGGPAFLISNGYLQLAGVTSRGVPGKIDELGREIGCSGEGFYTDVFAHLDWITENI